MCGEGARFMIIVALDIFLNNFVRVQTFLSFRKSRIFFFFPSLFEFGGQSEKTTFNNGRDGTKIHMRCFKLFLLPNQSPVRLYMALAKGTLGT